MTVNCRPGVKLACLCGMIAQYWLSSAAGVSSHALQGGEVESMRLLARMCEKGYGCAPDPEEAERWEKRYQEAVETEQ
jgi:TPR repeat protein